MSIQSLKTKKNKLEKQIAPLQKEKNEIEEKIWEEENRHLYKNSIGKCYGINELHKKDGYLTYFKHLSLDDREFLIVQVEIRKTSYGDIYSQNISKESKFYYHGNQIGNVYPEITLKEFNKVYQQVLNTITV